MNEENVHERRVEILKVSARSRSTAVAGAIAGVIREGNVPDVQAIGAGAVNQAVKACAIARTYLQEDGIEVYCIPAFVEIEIEGQERTAVKITVDRISNLVKEYSQETGFGDYGGQF